jgi:hypothetical protein
MTVMLVLTIAGSAHSATNIVTSLADGGAGSLRQALAESAAGDSIVFGVTGTITLTSGELVIDKDLAIIGPGTSALLINGGGFQVFSGVHFTVKHLTVTNCWRENGAAICNQGGHLLVQDCVFSRNTASASAAGSNGCGGAVFNAGTANITSSTFVGNSAIGAAGSDAPWGGPTLGGSGGAGCGGAVYNLGTLELGASTFLGNTVRGGGGGRGGDGAPAPTIPSPGGMGGLGGDGSGGALFNAGVATVVNSTFTSNSAYGGTGGAGGAGGTSFYSGYPPRYYGGEGGNGCIGGLACGAVCATNGLCFLTNCTIASNSGFGGAGGPGGPGGGGGLGNGPPGFPGPDGQALGSLRGAGTVLVNSVLSGNAPGGNCSGVITDAGHNLSSDASWVFTNSGSMNNTDPKLGSLTNNGGPTLTMALLPGSPAIDAGNTAVAPATDQRGFPRPAGAAADIGAHEYGSVMPTLAVSRSGAIGLNILGSGNAGQSCRLVVSPDLLSWVAVATNQIGGDGTVLFQGTFAPGSACRFYRLVMP